jgi:hypothetical protein
MRINKLAALFIIAIIVSPNLTIVRGQNLTLAPFDGDYAAGDDVSISGTAVAEANLTLIVVFNSTSLYEANFTAEGDGNYTEDYLIPGNATDGVYTVTVSDGVESVNADFTVASDNSMELAETLIEQAEDARDNVEDAFDELEDEGVEIPQEANSSYLQGIEYLDMAKEDFDEGNYIGASDMAFEAIQLFGYAFEGVQDLIPVEPDDVEAIPVEPDDVEADAGGDETGNPERLAVAIERAYAYWEKINETVTRLSEEEFDVTKVVEALKEAEGHLENASIYQIAGDHTAAVREFRAARTSLGRIHGFIESKIKERKEKQTEQFLAQFQRRVEKITGVEQFLAQFQRRVEKITGVLEGLQESLEAGKTQRVQAILRSTARKLLRLSDSLGGGDLEGVLDEMEDAVDELEDGIDELNGEGLSKQLKSANRFDAKIESLNRTLQRLVEAGFETAELGDYVADAQALLESIEAEVRAGDGEAAEELIEEAEELIDEAQEHFKEFQKDARKASSGEESGRGRPDSPGRSGRDDDEDDEDDGDSFSASSGGRGSSDVAEELVELNSTIIRIEENLGELNTTSVNVTKVEHLIEEAKALMEEAEGLVEDEPDRAGELIEAAEEILDEVSDIIEELTDTEDVEGVDSVTSDVDDDDDDLGDDDDHDDLGDDDDDDHGDGEEPETTV